MQILQFLASVLLIVAFSFIFALPSSAMTLPQLMHHDGLTFEQPLTISHHITSVKPLTLSFGETKVITIKQSTETNLLAETIVSPTPIEEKTVLDKLVPKVVADELDESKNVKITPILTSTPTPTDIPQPTPTPQASYQLSNGGLDAEKLFSMSNSYRQSKGLPPFQKDERSCQLAASRAPEIAGEVAGGHMHSGLRDRNLPYWNSENIISMRTEEAAFNWWVNDKIHHDAIIGNYTYSCVACHGNSCAQEFTNFQPK